MSNRTVSASTTVAAPPSVVEFEDDRCIAWRHFGAHRWRYQLEPTDDGGTVVTETWDATRYNPLAFQVLGPDRVPRAQPPRDRADPGSAARGGRGLRLTRELVSWRVWRREPTDSARLAAPDPGSWRVWRSVSGSRRLHDRKPRDPAAVRRLSLSCA